MLEANSSTTTTTVLAQPRPRPRLSLLKLRSSSHGSKKAFKLYENLSSFRRKKIAPEAEMTSSYRTTGIPVLKRPSQTSFLHSTFKSAASCRPNKTASSNGVKVQLTNKCNNSSRPVRARQNGSVDSDSSSSRCSTDSLIVSQLEKQEIPSQMVATLAGQFNALIERRKVQQRQLKSPSDNQNIIVQSQQTKSPSTNRIIIQKKKTEVTTTIRSCPSSPQPTSGAFTRGKWSSVGHSGVGHSGSVSVNRSRSSLGSLVKSDLPKRNASVASTDSCDSAHGERTSFRSLKDDSKLTAVQRAARNYESALNLHKAIISSSSSALSSPTTTTTSSSSSSRISVNNYSDLNTKARPKVKPPEVPASMLRPKLELNHLKNDLSTSMDLLAEIDCHLKCSDNNNTVTTGLKEPNRSFLWKSSTQKRFSEQTEEEVELEDDDSEHLYEELTTFLSIQNRDRLDVPLAVPENDSSSSSSSYGYAAASLSYSVARCSLKSNSSNSEQGQKETVTEADAESDGGSWADDSDDEGQHWRRSAFRRKAWNRNARDSESKTSSKGEVQSGGEGLWEDGGTDENIYEPLTEPEDVSSRVSGGGKKVKRNWSWSKTRTEFHLDISSKLGRIRPTAKKGSNSQSSQPNSNQKWPFKGSTGEVYKATRKTSPTEASAQFYVPSSSSSSSSTINDVGGKMNNRRSSSYLSRPTAAPPLPPVQINSGTTAKEDTDDDSSSTGISRSSESISRGHENDELPKRFLYLDDTYYIDEDHKKLSPFDNEPLYQFYTMAAQQRSAHENQVESSDEEDCYESVNQVTAIIGDDVPNSLDIVSNDLEENKIQSIPSAMELVRLTEGGVRTLWCEVPEVVASGVLQTITTQQRNLQEAMFEVITSEASYLKSLNILINHFMMCPMFLHEFSSECVLSKRERHVLFSDVIPVKETSERLLEALEKRWQENILLSDICDILLHHATKYFEVYVKYCSNQLYQDRCLKKLKESNNDFVDVIRRLESNPTCQGLNMYSFLMLPMQRITRLPLLLDAILNRLDSLSLNYDTCKQALATLNKIVHECNEGAQRMARMEEMLNISRQLDFRMFKGLALISASRWLIKQGELVRLLLGDSCKLSFGRSRFPKQVVHLFLFTDILIVTKKKSDDCYHVVDYSPRNMLQVTEGPDQLPDRLLSDGCRNLFQLTMLQNHNGKTVEMFFSCPMESDRTRWVEAIAPKRSEDPDEKIYEEWDCPQVQAIHNYTAQQPDELSLEESDVVNVFRKMADGWYQGERIRDGSKGWFPANYTVEIVSSHVRARNLRQRYRLLALSQSYLEQQQRKDYKLIKC